MSRWDIVITEYLSFLIAIGRPKTTVVLRRDQLLYLARTINLPFGAVTHKHLIDWFSIHQEWKPETRRSYRSGIRGFFSWAKEIGTIDDDPAAKLPQVSIPKTAPRPAPDDVYQQGLANADARTALMLQLGAKVGLRRGEIARVHTKDLRHGPMGAQLLVHGKGAKERVVPIASQLAVMIAAGAAGHTPHAPTTGWLFPSERGGHISPHWVGQLCSAALPGGWTLHTLRHAFATKAYRGTRDIRAVQELLGHSNPTITQRYTAVDDDAMRAAMMAAIG